jgi:hypothetical protein
VNIYEVITDAALESLRNSTTGSAPPRLLGDSPNSVRTGASERIGRETVTYVSNIYKSRNLSQKRGATPR